MQKNQILDRWCKQEWKWKVFQMLTIKLPFSHCSDFTIPQLLNIGIFFNSVSLKNVAFSVVRTLIALAAMYVFHKYVYLMINAKLWVTALEQMQRWFFGPHGTARLNTLFLYFMRPQICLEGCLPSDPRRCGGRPALWQCHPGSSDMTPWLHAFRFCQRLFQIHSKENDHTQDFEIHQKSGHTLFCVGTGAIINQASSMGSVSESASWMKQLKSYI